MSSLANWCYKQKMSLYEYKELERKIDEEAARLVLAASSLHKTGTGVYYPVEALITEEVQRRYDESGLLDFLQAALIEHGVEFYDNRSLYRI